MAYWNVNYTRRVKFMYLFLGLWWMIGHSSSLLAQCILTCQTTMDVGIGANGTTPITPATVAVYVSPVCSNNLTLELYSALGVRLPNTLTAHQVGTQVIAIIQDPISGTQCVTRIAVVDVLPPVVSVSDLFVPCNADVSPNVIGFPIFSDNVTPVHQLITQYQDLFEDLPCGTQYQGQAVTGHYTRTWTVSDASGNSASKVQHVYIKRNSVADVVFPAHRDGIAAPFLRCQVEDPNNLARTGTPTIAGQAFNNGGICDLVTSFQDQVIPVCGGEIKVLRTWVVLDYCSNTTVSRIQLILVRDVSPPLISCPSPMVVGTLSDRCAAHITLPLVTATDACSSVTTQISWAFGTGRGPFQDVPVGTHTVTYTATDACANVSTCTMTVKVVDDDVPTPICKASVAISIPGSGAAILPASVMDDGSFDNCGITLRQIKRVGGTFQSQLTFTCADVLNSPVQMVFQVTDAAGLSNQCAVEVRVQDGSVPTIVCPSDKNITCDIDIFNFNVVGRPQVLDNCGTPTTTFRDTDQRNSCGIGTVLRLWYVSDAYGNRDSCLQRITVQDTRQVFVVFPPDKTIFDCQLPPSPAQTGAPTTSGGTCFDLDVTYTDALWLGNGGSCGRIIRHWKVYDFCRYNPNVQPLTGYWESLQIIYVQDTVAPVLVMVDSIVVDLPVDSCLANVVLDDIQFTDCSTKITLQHDSPFAQANNNLSGRYPIGYHKIIVTATDACGNTSLSYLHLTVRDRQAPTALCRSGVSLNLNANGTASLPSIALNGGSSDACTPAYQLQYTTSPSTFDCTLLGNQTVQLRVKDAAGNIGVCSTTVLVKDPYQVCPKGRIYGTILSPTGKPVSGVEVTLQGLPTSRIEMTDSSGRYTFQDLPQGQSYTLTCSKRNAPLRGVTTFDILLISRHLLGLTSFDDPYKVIAADANANQYLTVADMVTLRQAVLEVIPSLPVYGSWRFVDANQVFAQANNPFAQVVRSSIIVDRLGVEPLDVSWVGIKIGDVNYSGDN